MGETAAHWPLQEGSRRHGLHSELKPHPRLSPKSEGAGGLSPWGAGDQEGEVELKAVGRDEQMEQAVS